MKLTSGYKRRGALLTRRFREILAFHRVDALVALACIILLAIVVLPVMANIGPRSERIGCMNNLRLISRAFYQWSTEHGGQMQWLVPVAQGGTQGHVSKDNLWFQLSWVSNYLESPRLFADPGDERRNLRVAGYWDNTPNGGLRNAGYQNNSVSYFLGIHAVESIPRSVLLGDRNMASQPASNCPIGVGGNLRLINSQSVAWTNSVHREPGNIAYMDGGVEQCDNPALKRVIQWDPVGDDSPIVNTHFVFPF